LTKTRTVQLPRQKIQSTVFPFNWFPTEPNRRYFST